MTRYSKAIPARLDDEELLILERIKATGTPGHAVSQSDAIRIALRFWGAQHLGPGPAQVLQEIRDEQESSEPVKFWGENG